MVFFQKPPRDNITLPPFTSKEQIVNWVALKGSITSMAVLDDPKSAVLRLGRGQLLSCFWVQAQLQRRLSRLQTWVLLAHGGT